MPVSERGHSEAAQDSERPQHSEAAQDSERAQGSPAETPTATEFDTKDPWVRVPLKVRFRSALLLLLGAIGSAVVIGAVIGVFVVALILLVA